jgi:hypothetical protein
VKFESEVCAEDDGGEDMKDDGVDGILMRDVSQMIPLAYSYAVVEF